MIIVFFRAKCITEANVPRKSSAVHSSASKAILPKLIGEVLVAFVAATASNVPRVQLLKGAKEIVE